MSGGAYFSDRCPVTIYRSDTAVPCKHKVGHVGPHEPVKLGTQTTSATPARRLTVEPGDYSDVCPLCGIHRQNAGFLKATCGDGYLKPECFVREALDAAS